MGFLAPACSARGFFPRRGHDRCIESGVLQRHARAVAMNLTWIRARARWRAREIGDASRCCALLCTEIESQERAALRSGRDLSTASEPLLRFSGSQAREWAG